MLRELSLVGQALSDPIRLRILKLLAVSDLCVCELVYLLPASQSRVSQNLSILRYAGLVTDTREGRWVHYALNRPAFEQALADLRTLTTEACLEGVPEMAGEAERWARMQTDNPRGICQPDPVGAGNLEPDGVTVRLSVVKDV
jgi:ArsR family transcriptional regulator